MAQLVNPTKLLICLLGILVNASYINLPWSVQKMGEYTLIITEKPDAAKRIAVALDEKGTPQKMHKNRVPYYVVKRDKKIVVVPALGHLYTVTASKGGSNQYPVFDFKWTPRYVAEKSAKQTRTWLDAISKLAEDADSFIDACDYDIEGSIIGYNILRYACKGKEKAARRMKYSTLTKEELEKSYADSLPHLDFALIEAGRARHEVDWLYGINLTRALTIAARSHSGRYTTISTGRVQGPTLKFIVAREKTIRNFVPTPYWQIRVKIKVAEQILEAQYEKDSVETKRGADAILGACRGKNGKVETLVKRQFLQPPPVPFDLGTLQSEAYRLFKYLPRRTSAAAQRLYLDALVSYPRTSSQKLPPTIDYRAILRNLNKIAEYRKPSAELLSRPELTPREGNREDPAHPAIYPTGRPPQRALECSERNVWDLIVRRFMAVFAEPAAIQSIIATISINSSRFHLSGKRILKEGWRHFYEPYATFQETSLPPLEEGRSITVKSVAADIEFTQPPPRYNPGSILRRMEKTEIGTKATRADIIQTLYDRKYVIEERMMTTDLGFEVLNVLERHCPTVVSAEFTKELEEKMNSIRAGSQKRDRILADTIETLRPILEELKKNQKSIGERLSEALSRMRTDERIIGSCPECRTGKLTVLHSRKTGKRFVGCSNYFKGLCKTSFPLPQRGFVRPLGKTCRHCGWPAVQVRNERRYTWTLCLNPHCPSKKERKERNEMRNMR